tara:strand:+ start:7185 stop:8045 length:861 start_codon:yes stop_codon:yes gene_type:complete
MIINHRENDNFLEQARQNKIPQGLGIDNNLDNNLRYKTGSFNIILGHANVGKTYWVLWYFLALSKIHGKKHLIYSAENSVNGLKRNLIDLYAGKKIKDQTKKELEKNKKFIEEHFDFIDHNKIIVINEFMKSIQSINKKYDTIMIDPINAFAKPRGINAHEHDYETASKLRLFAKKFNTSIYVCMHASTEALRKVHPAKHDYEGLPIRPNGADAEGGGKWLNRCDDFISIHRYTQSENSWMFTQIHVLKVKETETGGCPTFFDEPILFRLEQGIKFTCAGINSLEV